MGATADEFCLRWNDFESNIASAFRHLRSDPDFFDVSLACPANPGGNEAHTTLKAHKVILSSCSPYFRHLLRDLQSSTGNQVPLIVMRGVSQHQMAGILDFMYYGQANVAQDDLDMFLALAEELQVKGLTQSKSGGDQQSNKKRVSNSGSHPSPPKKHKTSPSSTPVVPPAAAVSSFIKTESESTPHPANDNEDSEAYYDFGGQDDSNYDDPGEGTSSYTDGDKQATVLGIPAAAMELSRMDEKDYQARVKALIARDSEGNHVCSFCSKSSRMADVIATHIEGIHLRLGRYPCKYCGKVFNTRCANVMHVRKKHKELSLLASAFGDHLATELTNNKQRLASEIASIKEQSS